MIIFGMFLIAMGAVGIGRREQIVRNRRARLERMGWNRLAKTPNAPLIKIVIAWGILFIVLGVVCIVLDIATAGKLTQQVNQ